jgi:SET domain-containing protein
MNPFPTLANWPSQIHGTGCFAVHSILKGDIIRYWATDLSPIDEEKYRNSYDPYIKQTSVRLIGPWFCSAEGPLQETDYINHSEDPNCIHYCGLLIALKHIRANEEITLDYRLLGSENSLDVVEAYSPLEALQKGFEQVFELYKSLGLK